MNIINDITEKIIKHIGYLADKPLRGQAALTGAVEDTLSLMMEIGADIIIFKNLTSVYNYYIIRTKFEFKKCFSFNSNGYNYLFKNLLIVVSY